MQPVGVQRPEEFEGTLEARTQQRAEALIVVSGVLFTEHRHQLAALATTARLPMMAYRRQFVEAGGLMAYGTNLRAIYRRAAIDVDKILKGAKLADLPVEQPMTSSWPSTSRPPRHLGSRYLHRSSSRPTR